MSLFPKSEEFAATLKADGEFILAARYWNGSFSFDAGPNKLEIKLHNGVPEAGAAQNSLIRLTGSSAVWEMLTAAIPPRFYNDLMPAVALGLQPDTAAMGLELHGDKLTFTQYFPALARALELLRPQVDSQALLVDEGKPQGSIDAPVGRYLHVTIDGCDHRVYFEEAGQGIPLILHHTAGAHGTQWRHVLEDTELQQHFRMIAYDLPFHGKSIPPTGRVWWTSQFLLTQDFLYKFVLSVKQALNLEQPVFMGCSVGGLLALDLACHHPEHFRAVIAVEGALKIDGDSDDFIHRGFYHPRVSNEFKGRAMHSLTSPTAPEAYRRETIQIYMAGWPQAFIGDLNYYSNEVDLREAAKAVDTSRIGVHILNGEYDFSGSIELGQAAHAAIKGSTWTAMEGMGHFPMCEDPERFLGHVRPILAEIRKKQTV